MALETNARGPFKIIDTIPPVFAQLLPGTIIQAGDIKCTMQEGAKWGPVSDKEIGLPVPSDSIAIARLSVPEGCQALLGDHALIDVDDLVWIESDPRWAIRDLAGNKTLGEARKFYRQQVYAAHPGTKRQPGTTIPMPPRTRPLFTEEVLRRGDLVSHHEGGQWHEIGPAMLGRKVKDPSFPDTPLARFCRPIHARAQNWYVDLRVEGGTGNDTSGIGSMDRPFATLTGAQKAIDDMFDRSLAKPYGVIWNVDGTPLFAYDVVEPLPREAAEPVHLVIEAEEANPEQVTTVVPPSQPPKIDQLCCTIRCTREAFHETAQEAIPAGFRLKTGHEETLKTDLCFLPVTGFEITKQMAWQPIPASLVGLPVMSVYSDAVYSDEPHWLFATQVPPRGNNSQSSSQLVKLIADLEADLEACLTHLRKARAQLQEPKNE